MNLRTALEIFMKIDSAEFKPRQSIPIPVKFGQ
jgi:hypothetical protein